MLYPNRLENGTRGRCSHFARRARCTDGGPRHQVLCALCHVLRRPLQQKGNHLDLDPISHCCFCRAGREGRTWISDHPSMDDPSSTLERLEARRLVFLELDASWSRRLRRSKTEARSLRPQTQSSRHLPLRLPFPFFSAALSLNPKLSEGDCCLFVVRS
jgi:hypothetical protein